MKNTKIMAILVVLLVAALFIGSAAADPRPVGSNAVVFAGEEINSTVTLATGGYLYQVNPLTNAVINANPIANISGVTGNFTIPANVATGFYTWNATKDLALGTVITPVSFSVSIATVKLTPMKSSVTVNNPVDITVEAFGVVSTAAAAPALDQIKLNYTYDGKPNTEVNVGTNGVASITTTPNVSTIVITDVKINGYSLTYTPVGVSIDVVEPGQDLTPVSVGAEADVFVYERIQVEDTIATKLTQYTDGQNPTVVNQISGSAGKFYLTEEVVGGHYGKYVYNTSATGYVYIWYPELGLQAELTTGKDTNGNGITSGDSIDGKTVNKDTNVTFLVNAPKVGPAFVARGTGEATTKIIFTTPVAGKTTSFGAENFDPVTLTAAQTNTKSVSAGQDAAAGTWTAQAEYKFPTAFKDYAKKSNTISFTLQSSTLTITAAKDSVVRSNPFTVTISGKAQTVYAIYLENAVESDINPILQPNQNGWQSNFTLDKTLSTEGTKVYGGAFFKTDASGKRTIQYNTAANTEDKTYTIKVNGLKTPYSTGMTAAALDTADYDKVKVKVEKGAVTITASGDGSYYIGDEIKLTGTNTDSTNVFLFLTGQNLLENGIVLKSLPDKVAAYKAANPVSVKTDNTWEFKWDTSQCALDTGAYTIYATSRLTNGKSSDAIATPSIYGTNGTAVKLSDSEYATISVNLKQPFLSAVPSGTVIAQGDKLYVRGTAEGKPNNLNLYIFGPNFFEDHSITVEDDGSYEKKIEISNTMSSNQYFVVVQHPMYNGVFDAVLVKNADKSYQYFKIDNQTTGGSQQASFVVWGNNKLQGSQAADALTKMIDDANIDDIYTKLTFTVAAPWIRINNPGDQAVGSKFTITGTTNLAIGDQILVEVMSSSFTAVDKTSTSTTSGVSQTTKVVAGEGADNAWAVDVDTTNWKLDQYTIRVNGIEVDVTTTADFNLVEKVVTPTPTATGATPTATATTTATTTPTQTPGFGAFIALAGLGAVALLVLRRN